MHTIIVFDINGASVGKVKLFSLIGISSSYFLTINLYNSSDAFLFSLSRKHTLRAVAC